MHSFIENILIFCSGANRHYLDQCPSERHKFRPIGFSVLITTSLAIISMYYATNLIFGEEKGQSVNQVAILFFSLFWGLAIFSIDWGLVTTMRKPVKERSFIRELFTPAVLFRLAVAVIISYSISRPLEVVIYEKRLKAQIEMDRRTFVRQEMDRISNENSKNFNGPLDSIRASNTDIAKTIAEGPKTITFTENSKAYADCKSELENLRTTNYRKITELRQLNRNISNNPIYRDAVNNQLTSDAINRIEANKRKINGLNIEVNNKRSECDIILGKLNDEKQIHQNQFGEVQQKNTQFAGLLMDGYVDKIKEDSIVLSGIEDKAKISFDPENPGLITSLESLANFEKTPEGGKVWMIRLILLLIFICIDTAPIVVKLLTKRGPYEEIQEAEEEKLRYLTTAEKNANMLLISNIAKAQNRVLRLAIDNYEATEMEELRKKRDKYQEFIQTDSNKNKEE